MKNKTLANLIYEKTKYKLRGYCEIKGLSYAALKAGFVSKKTAVILDDDDIKWRIANNACVRGGKCASRTKLNHNKQGSPND